MELIDAKKPCKGVIIEKSIAIQAVPDFALSGLAHGAHKRAPGRSTGLRYSSPLGLASFDAVSRLLLRISTLSNDRLACTPYISGLRYFRGAKQEFFEASKGGAVSFCIIPNRVRVQ